MVDPYLFTTSNSYTITITLLSLCCWTISALDHASWKLYNIVDIYVRNDYVLDIHKGETPVGDLNFRPSTIDGLVAGYHELLSQRNHHIFFKSDPQGPALGDTEPECAFFWICRIIIRFTGDNVDITTFSACSPLCKTLGTIGHRLSIVRPVCFAPPALVHYVHCFTCLHAPPGRWRTSHFGLFARTYSLHQSDEC
ncbi:hypothetical protein HanXRQr2_Chr17g0795741 [Helianthus annuus]|uniref:Uncharacterized protein n=1 Tax=Helianthus annuus TaxID=4232 RepID=A0A9K3DJ47_HELAN|nr:hypothetical protein HanXRQr2_Chr17g0795741 [Helianthus annuus]